MLQCPIYLPDMSILNYRGSYIFNTKRIENIKSLELFFCLSNIDNQEEPIIKTKDIRELVEFLLDYRSLYGENWNQNLLFHIDSETGNTIMMVDVAKIEMFV